MRLTVFAIMFSVLQTLAVGVVAQQNNISLEAKDVSMVKIFSMIEKQTGFSFMFKDEYVSRLDKVSVSIENIDAEAVLKKLLNERGLDYVKDGNVIIVMPKKIKVVVKQQDKITVKGKVVDEKGNALPAVTVQVQGTTIGVATDNRGRYTIQAKKSDALKFSFIGYKPAIVLIQGKEKIDIKLFPEVESLEEVSVVAFGTQKKESVVSSITSVKSEALKSSNSDLTSTFAGKIAGVIGWQTGGMPGAMTEDDMNTKFYIRGITSYQTDANIDPLILLDGVEVSKLDLARIDPDDIESFNVMKDASATAMYGARGANGVIYVKTKKGKEGNVYTSFRYEKIWSKPTREIDVVNPVDYMKYYNQAYMGRVPGGTPIYTAEKIRNTASGKFPGYVYPAVDWYDQLFKDKVVNNHYAVNVRGGTSKMQYYASITHNDDNGMIKTDRLNQFDCNIISKQTTFRTNLNIDLNKGAKLTLTSFSTFDDYSGPIKDVRQAYYLAFHANPVDFAPVYPADAGHNWPHIRFGSNQSSNNPYAEIHSGYMNKKRFSTINKFEYIQNLSSFVKGLELRTSAAMSKVGFFQNAYVTTPAFYSLRKYDQLTGEHTLTALNPDRANRTLGIDFQNNKRESATSMEYQLKLLHSAAWGDHQTSLTGVFSVREEDNSTPGEVLNSLPKRNLSYAARGTYGFKDRYFIEASFGLNGSERFSKENKIGFFPALGAAWIASKENFLRSSSTWLNYLKFRFSYGKVGNDGVIKDPRFVYLQEVSGDLGNFLFGDPIKRRDLYSIRNYGNPNTTWEISEQTNLGTDVKLFKGLIEFNIDAYQEIRHNIYSYRFTVPASVGLYQPQLDNIGKVKAHGLDFSGKLQKAISPDLWFILNGTFTYNKAKFEVVEEASSKPEWMKKKGREISQQFGYIAEGLFQDYEEIKNAPFQGGDVQPGDIRYKDIDGNNTIDVNDAVPIGYPETPRIIYGMSGVVHYKNLEFSFAFQGSGNRSFWINPEKVSPFSDNRALLTAFANDHWTEDNQKENPLWPRLSTQNIIEHNPQENYYADDSKEIRKSTYFMRNGKFLRCKNMEFAVYLNKSWLKKIKLKKCRFYLRANNPFIISDFDLWDIELGENGFNYPIQKTYTFGVNVSF